MKKLLFLLSMSMFFLCSQAQDSTKLTVKQVYEDAKTGITKVVQALGGPAKHVYAVYVRQHQTEGIVFCGISLIFFVIPFWFVVANLINGKKLLTEDENPNGRCIAMIIFGVIGFVGLVVTILDISDALQQLINPEYYAIQDIIQAFK